MRGTAGHWSPRGASPLGKECAAIRVGPRAPGPTKAGKSCSANSTGATLYLELGSVYV